MNYTHEEMLAMIYARQAKIEQESRELSTRETDAKTENSADFSSRPREVYKNKKIKKENNISRDAHEESDCLEISKEIYPLAEPSDTKPSSSSPFGKEIDCQGERVSDISPATTSSREYTGIIVQHNISNTGIKLSITLQSAEDALYGECIAVTAELKRKDRFREIKDYAGDDDYFKKHVKDVIVAYKEMGDNWCIGRVHDRGKRSSWFANMLVCADVVDNVAREVHLWIGSEELYQIPMTMELSPGQLQHYKSGGLFGSLVSKKRVPTLKQAVRKAYNP
jgi:hypothetical protein